MGATTDLRSFSISSKQLFALLPLCFDPIILVQQVAKEFFFVKLAHQSILYDVFAMINKQMHNGFRNLIGNGLPNNVEVRGYETTDQLSLERFPIC